MTTLSALADAELNRMVDRAYRESARCWEEYRKYGGEILLAGAKEAEQWWKDPRASPARRRLPAAGGPPPATDNGRCADCHDAAGTRQDAWA
jgi:hypothetical protein